MATDRSLVVYDKRKDKGKDANGNDVEFEAPSRNAINDAVKRWAERNKHKKVSIEQQ